MIEPLKFNALEDGPMPDDRPPSVWHGPHVGRRIADAFVTLGAMPASRNRKSGLWPAYPYEFEDLLAQQEAEQRSPGPRRISPTIEQITRMEAALCWPAHYLGSRFPNMLAVNTLARERARGGNSTTIAGQRRSPYDARTWQRLHDEGCDVIARSLIRERVRVF